MKNKDVKITRIYDGKYGDLSVTMVIKPEDINDEDKKALRALWIAGETVDIEINLRNNDKQVTIQDEVKKQSSKYNSFRMACEYWGINYPHIKEKLKVEHLKDLEQKFDSQEIDVILKSELNNAKGLLGVYDKEY
jgi:hypothetical protein